MIKRILCLIMSLSMLFLFCACSPRGADANLYFPIDNDPGYLDPQVVSDPGAKNIIANCFEGLVRLDKNGKIEAGYAESWTVSSDGLTYTFKIRDDGKWAIMSASSDFLGEDFRKTFDNRVTAHDFAFGLKRALLPETVSPGAKNLFSIKNAEKVNTGKLSPDELGVKATDDYTLIITLSQPDPDFLYVLLEPECMPCNEEFFEATGGRYGLSTRFLMYNGPFYMSNWADDAAITLMSNDDYYDFNHVKPYSVYFSINSEQGSRLEKIKDKIYDLAPLSTEQAEKLQKKIGYTVEAFENGLYCLAFNCHDSALSNVNIRRAIASSFDRTLLYSQLKEGSVGGIIPPSMLISGSKYREAAGNVSLNSVSDPKKLLEDTLKKLGLDYVEVTVLCTEAEEKAVRSVMQKWQATLGVSFNVFVETATAEEIRTRISDGEWQIALTDISFPHLTAFNGLLQFTTGNSENILGFEDKKYDSLVGAIKTASGFDTSISATKEAEQYLLDSCVIIPLYGSPTYYGLGKGVDGVIFNSTGDVVYFRDTVVK